MKSSWIPGENTEGGNPRSFEVIVEGCLKVPSWFESLGDFVKIWGIRTREKFTSQRIFQIDNFWGWGIKDVDS